MGRLEEISATHVLPAMKYALAPEYCGHVASIAVLPQYRGMGVARQMMTRLHHNMAQYYNMDCVNLFCRVSKYFIFFLLYGKLLLVFVQQFICWISFFLLRHPIRTLCVYTRKS